ncbi:2348_t:CDS:2, partial [Funneliformis caledonium]
PAIILPTIANLNKTKSVNNYINIDDKVSAKEKLSLQEIVDY